jgi:eukaryotic-like serine/threonine-protein kinase
MTNTEPPEGWPTPDGETVVVNREHETLVGAPPPPPPAAPPPPPGDGPADRRIGAGMLLGILALLLVAAGIAIAYLLTHRGSDDSATTAPASTVSSTPAATTNVAVPRVVGLKEEEAVVRLAQVGLRPKEVYKPTPQPKGVVVSQKPAEAKQVAKGGQVTIVIDAGAPKVAVPDVTGNSLSEAQAALDKLGLDSAVTQVTSEEPSGTVVDEAPKAGAKLAKGSVVALSVAKQASEQQTTTEAATTTAPTTTATTPSTTTASTPPAPTTATVPDVSGQSEAAAVQSLGQAGILASLVFVPSDDPLGTVEAQGKPAGTKVPYHSHVQLNLSAGPGEKPNVSVPGVVGQTLQQAVSSMNGGHLRLIYLKFPVSSRSQAGKVVQQSPQTGQAPQNAQVLVFLGAYQR